MTFGKYPRVRREEQSDPPGPAVRSRVWLRGQDERKGREQAGDKPRAREGGIPMQEKAPAEGCRRRRTGWSWRDRGGVRGAEGCRQVGGLTWRAWRAGALRGTQPRGCSLQTRTRPLEGRRVVGARQERRPPRPPQQPATCATSVTATRVLPMGYRGRLCPAHCPAFAMESTLSEWRRLIFFFLEIMVML